MADSRPNQAFKAAPKRQSQILSITTTFGVLKMAQDSRQETRTEAAFICSARLLSSCFFFLFPLSNIFTMPQKLIMRKKQSGRRPLKITVLLYCVCIIIADYLQNTIFSHFTMQGQQLRKKHSFLTSTYNCKSRNLLFDFSFHYVFNLHFVGMIYIFFVWMYIYEDVMASLLQASEFLNASRKRQGVVIG